VALTTAATLTALQPVSPTCNIIVITDPTGKDPNGAAAGSMSFAPNMFESTFLVSKKLHVAVLAGGLGKGTARLKVILNTIRFLELGAPITVAIAGGLMEGPTNRILVGGPGKGMAVGGSYDVSVVLVKGNKIVIREYHSAQGFNIVKVPPNVKGAIIHLRNTPGNPKFGTATHVRVAAAIMVGQMIRDGYPATDIVAKAMGFIAKESGEKYGGGMVNITAGLTTGDTFTPAKLGQKGFPMDAPYRKVCPRCGWSAPYWMAKNINRCPRCGAPLKTEYAWQVARDMITVSKTHPVVHVYGIKSPYDKTAIVEAAQVLAEHHKLNRENLASVIDSEISSNTLLDYDYIYPSDIKINKKANIVTVYMKPLPEGYRKPPLKIPIPNYYLHVLGLICSALGIGLIVMGICRELLLRRLRKLTKGRW